MQNIIWLQVLKLNAAGYTGMNDTCKWPVSKFYAGGMYIG
jgi:hypothetical protein